MNYEELYIQLQALEKDFKDKLTLAQKHFKSMAKNSEKGDLKSLYKDLEQMNTFVEDYKTILSEYTEITESFNIKEYMETGDFAGQMIEYCEKASVDVKGEYPTYEMFPHKVKIDSENNELVVDRKKVQCLRPQHFVNFIKQSQDKLNKAAFNVNAFLNELADAYDRAVAQKGKSNNSEQDILLKDLYPYMVPMQRFRKDYDMQSYAFDLARLYSSDAELTKDNRGFEFGPSRVSSKLIRILDNDGNEHFLGTVRFFER